MVGQRHAPAALPPGKTRYTLYSRLGGPQGRSVRVRKISPPLPPQAFDRRTVQPVSSRYTDWAIAALSVKKMPLMISVSALQFSAHLIENFRTSLVVSVTS